MEENKQREKEQLEKWRKEVTDRLAEKMIARKKITFVFERSLKNIERKSENIKIADIVTSKERLY